MENQNTGSFGAGLGGLPNLKQAMQRNGLDSSVLDQVSGAAAGPESPVAAPVQETDLSAAGAANTAPIDPDQEIALKALSDTVKSNNKIKRAAVGIN